VITTRIDAEHLISELELRPVASMAYATAAAAALHADGTAVFPKAVEWLRRHQHTDGSWGGTVFHPQDRLVSTLAALVALRDVRTDWAQRAIAAGSRYLREHDEVWRTADAALIGFEVVAPDLVERAHTAGLVSADGLADLAALRAEKLSRFPSGLVTEQASSLLYSLEAVLALFRPQQVTRFVGPDGSLANNPAATVAAWTATGDPRCLTYLHRAAESTGDGGMPEVYPIDVFEPAWMLYLLGRAGLTPPSAGRHVQRLMRLARERDGQGIGISEGFPAPDSDDTAMVANVLHAHGHDDTQLLKALLAFETDTHFAGFAYERGAPVSANARILEALSRRPELYGPQITKTTAFLLDTRQDGAWWQDKWHLSPYYATAQVTAALPPQHLAGTWRWLLDTQHPDGSWGMGGGQPEETAYAILALDALRPHHEPPLATYQRAHHYLRAHLGRDDYAELWIGKGLYTPTTVVRAAILAACHITDNHSHRNERSAT
jgi:halimadienyl-diphosphate synthase